MTSTSDAANGLPSERRRRAAPTSHDAQHAMHEENDPAMPLQTDAELPLWSPRGWFRHTNPRFGQLVVWLLTGFAIFVALYPFEPQTGPRQTVPATFLYWLPESVVRSPITYHVNQVVLLVSAACWMFRLQTSWSCLVAAASFSTIWALRLENVWSGAHVCAVANMLLWIHAFWWTAYRVPIHRALRDGMFFRIPLYPQWVLFLSVFYIGWFHTLAGVAKLSSSGFAWANGVSLQLWIDVFGWQESPVSQWIVANRSFAQLLQWGTLLIETGAILAIVDRRLRWAFGIGLLGLYAGILTTFTTFGFHFNALLVALFFLPLPSLLASLSSRTVGWREKSMRPMDQKRKDEIPKAAPLEQPKTQPTAGSTSSSSPSPPHFAALPPAEPANSNKPTDHRQISENQFDG